MRSVLVFAALLVVAVLAFPDVKGGALYGLNENVQLVSIDTSSGQTTILGNPLLDELQAQNLAAMDAKRSLYYMIGLTFFLIFLCFLPFFSYCFSCLYLIAFSLLLFCSSFVSTLLFLS
jgi:hypothetical protein